MAANTNIAWSTHSGSPWIGCTKVSPGCANCYAAEMDKNRFSRTMGGGTPEQPISHWGKGAPRFKTKGFWNDARHWNRNQEIAIKAHGPISTRPRIFPSLCDWLDDEAPIEWLADFLKFIRDTPNLDWLLLTKRPESFLRVRHIGNAGCATSPGMKFPQISQWAKNWFDGKPPSNIWVGVSVENQKRADERIPILLQIPAKVRFLSVEPLLEEITFRRNLHNYNIELLDWAIIGGESGPSRRDCGVHAIERLPSNSFMRKCPSFVSRTAQLKPGQRGRISDAIWALKQFPSLH